jgi:hypothetical protein
MEPRALHRALEDDDLMAESEVLRGECGAALEQLPEEGGDESQCAH